MINYKIFSFNIRNLLQIECKSLLLESEFFVSLHISLMSPFGVAIRLCDLQVIQYTCIQQHLHLIRPNSYLNADFWREFLFLLLIVRYIFQVSSSYLNADFRCEFLFLLLIVNPSILQSIYRQTNFLCRTLPKQCTFPDSFLP